MGANSSIEWTDATWSPIRARVKSDARDIAEAKGYTSLLGSRVTYVKGAGFGGSTARREVPIIIVGGESGPGARPFDLVWARSVRDQCKAAGVAFFMKQLGAHVIDQEYGYSQKDHKGGEMAEWPEDLRVREMPTVHT